MIGTLHILCSPNKPVHILNRIDPFAIAVIKFIKNMSLLGWKCVAYTIPGSEVPCQSVNCLPFLHSDSYENIKTYNRLAGEEIAKNKSANDLIMCFHGWENKEAADANPDLIAVEPSIGYDTNAIFAPYRIFTSYAQMHMFYGSKNMLMTPSWFDTVIPNAFDPDEFEFNDKKDDYILFFGRVIENKGINIAIQATKASGHRLIVAGPGSLKELGYEQTPSHVTCVGLCNADQRKELMKNALAVIGPTYYVEPFGNMIVEGYFSGTPAITSDWGGFVDTVVQGLTGFRCREFKEFAQALNNIKKLRPIDCYNFAMENYTEEIVHKKMHDYFMKVKSRNFYRE